MVSQGEEMRSCNSGFRIVRCLSVVEVIDVLGIMLLPDHSLAERDITRTGSDLP